MTTNIRIGARGLSSVAAAVAVAMAFLPSRAAAVDGYVGCYTDQVTSRALPTTLIASGATVESCIAAATAQNLVYAGLQNGGQCFGGNALGYAKVDNSSCSTPCTANSAETCGGSSLNSVYATNMDMGETAEVQFTSADAAGLATKAASLGSPVAIYEYMSNETEYALYHGARSGSVNSFMGARGNDVDLAAALIAMLRSRGIPARYAVGTVRISSTKLANWLGVENVDLAYCLLRDQGIQSAVLSSDKSYIDMEHVWVEALVPYAVYRGAGPATVNCATNRAACNWVSLDPSFKQHDARSSGLDPYSSLSFDYTAYYNAIKNNDSARRDKNPLEIYENQILDWLQANAPGKTLDDIPDILGVTRQEAGLLPASLPYVVTGAVRRYSSVAAHDAAVPSAEPKKWGKTLSLQIAFTANISGGGTVSMQVGAGPVLLTQLTTQRLTLTTEINGSIPEMVLRLGGVEIARPIKGGGTIVGYTPAIGDPFTITVFMDGAPAPTSTGSAVCSGDTASSSTTDQTISATYNAIVGGYYLLASGGETSNWSQVHRAAQQLLTANSQYKIVFNPSESGCLADGTNCTPYVDVNGNGWDSSDPRLLDKKDALDALTGGLLYVAATQYYAKVRDQFGRVDALNKIKTPIGGFLGVVSTTYGVEYVAGTAFAVLPDGLLIDMKGITIQGCWRIDQPASFSNSHFQFLGHVVSSLEHETWQELVGYDAISTVRGIQMALANGATLLNPKKNQTTDTVSTTYAGFGFSVGAAPSGFTYTTVSSQGTQYAAWTNSQTAGMDVMRAAVSTSTAYPDYALAYYQYSGGSASYALVAPSGTGQDALNFFDLGRGFSQGSYVYRVYPAAEPAQFSWYVWNLRNDLYIRDLTKYWVEYYVPSQQPAGTNFKFAVDIRYVYDTPSGKLVSATYEIQNNTGIAAGGGYVPPGGRKITASASIKLGSGSVVPTFNNSTFTDKNTIAETNNDKVKTASTADPVSTVTGNNFHDETDFTIKGRGIDYAFTRTYNSAPSSKVVNGPLGYGWTHSYAMRLKSNDYGACPNCTSAQASVNGNNKTSSVTYTDERGGEHNYLVNESTYAVTPPQGEFDSLAFDSPAAGQHTITFRSGVKYVFEGSSTIKTTPGVTARLKQIVDPWGNQLNFAYDGSGRLSTVTDNLGISGRTGLVFTYDGSGHLSTIRDWSGRTWTYSVNSSGDLATFTNPLAQVLTYTYGPGLHNLFQIVKPLQRNGQPVQTAFTYYQNGRTFNYANSLGNTETLDYDLFRRTTRVTDPRGGIREYEYDDSGRMTRLVEPDGAILRFDNTTADGLRYKKADGLGYVTQYSYRSDKTFNSASDTGGNVTREQDPLSQTIDTTYGIYDQVATVKDKRGTVRTTSFHTTTDSSCAVTGKPSTVTLSALSGVSNVSLAAYCWNSDGALKSQTEYIVPGSTARYRRSTVNYDTAAHLNASSIVLAGSDGSTVTKSFTYDSLGRKKTETLARRTSPTNPALMNLTTTYTYDVLDRVTLVEDAIGNRIETVYDANGQVYQVIGHYKQPDASYVDRIVSTRTYDAADRMSQDTDVYGHTTTYGYDASGNVVSVTDANGHTTLYEYDELNRRTVVVDANGNRTETTYDLAGHVKTVKNANGEVLTNQYDALGRLSQVTDAKGFVTLYGYDPNGNRTCTIDANAQAGLQPKNAHGCSEYVIYDELDRAVTIEDARSAQTVKTYDLLGNVTSIRDAGNHTTTMGFDDLGRLKQTIDPLGKSTYVAVDEAGNAYQVTNRLNQVTQVTYDALNRPTNVAYLTDGTSETFTYDPYGNQQTAANGTVTYTFAYDLKNRLRSKIDSRSGKQLLFDYDNAGNLLTKTDYQGDQTVFQYDFTNRIVAMRNKAYLSARYQYDPAGRLLTRILSDGARSEYTWDANGWLSTLRIITASATVLSSSSYTRDRVGNITALTDGYGTSSYVYDPDYRLTSAAYAGAGTETFTYDNVGNRQVHNDGTAHYYEYVASSNRLWRVHTGSVTGPVEKTLTYDDEGRLTAQSGGSSNGYPTTIAWDQKNRARSMTSSKGSTTTFLYDPLDYRIGRTGGSLGQRDYYLEGEHLEAEYSGGVLQSKYFRGVSTDELVAGFALQNGTLVPSIYHHDQVMSVSALSSHDGQTQATVRYGAFGSLLASSGTSANRLWYTGRELEYDTQLYYYRARYYDPTVGRFISEDPLGFRAGVNFYAYVGNNPVNGNDPTGLEPYLSRYSTRDEAARAAALDIILMSPGSSHYEYGGWTYQNLGMPTTYSYTKLVTQWNSDNVTISTTLLPQGTQGSYSLQPAMIHSHSLGLEDTFSSKDMTQLNTLAEKASSKGFSGPYDSYLYSFESDTLQKVTLDQPNGTLSPTSTVASDLSKGDFNLDLNGRLGSLDMPGAAGGFLLYPNKPNTNALKVVYNK